MSLKIWVVPLAKKYKRLKKLDLELKVTEDTRNEFLVQRYWHFGMKSQTFCAYQKVALKPM